MLQLAREREPRWFVFVVALMGSLLLRWMPAIAAPLIVEAPAPLTEQILLAATEFATRGEMAYIAFPALIELGSDQVLISYKRGQRHAADAGAILEAITLNGDTGLLSERRTLGSDPNLIFQMGEWIRFPDGAIASLVDVQQPHVDQSKARYRRAGIHQTRSVDQGRTFSSMRKLGPIEGVEYGYAFDSVTVGERLYLLAMSFPELTAEGRTVDANGRRLYGQVSVLMTDDSGDSWRHVRNLSHEFGGIDINECAFIRDGEDFLVVTRGYDNQARIHRVDHNFYLLQQRSLTDDCPLIESHLGRPRLFSQDGSLYLIARNWREGRMELALLRADARTLELTRYLKLDPAERPSVRDGYYAVPYFRGSAQGRTMNVITYRRFGDQPCPNLIQLRYRWDDLR